MLTFSLLAFGACTGTLLAALVGVLGSHHRIGFGWAFLLSVVFTPVVGLIVVLLSDSLPEGERRWGCVGTILGGLVIATAVTVLVLMMMAL